MARPAFVFCDTDAAIQFLLAGEVRPFRLLKSKYSVQPIVVPEVEIELRSNRRFGPRIAGELKKAFANDVLRTLNSPTLEHLYGGPPAGSVAAAATLGKIASLGREYQKHVDPGEAYTHAAALTLGVPSLSHDRTAIDALISARLDVPTTVLRALDLITLSYQANDMSENDCDDFRSTLLREKEWVPACFLHRSFADGLRHFTPRITDSSLAYVGKKGGSSLPFCELISL